MWDQKYEDPSYLYGTEPNDFLREWVHLFSDKHVLSLAEGEGRNGVFLAKQNCHIDAIDSSIVGLRKAQQLATLQGVTINPIHADVTTYSFPHEKYDAVYAIFCHLPRSMRRSLHTSILKTLKPNGIFLLEAYSEQQLGNTTGGPQNIDLLYTLSELESDFKDTIHLHSTSTTRSIIEGSGHTGEGSTVQFICKKKEQL